MFVYSASSSGPPAAEGYFAGGLVYSASSSGPNAAEGYFARGIGLLC